MTGIWDGAGLWGKGEKERCHLSSVIPDGLKGRSGTQATATGGTGRRMAPTPGSRVPLRGPGMTEDRKRAARPKPDRPHSLANSTAYALMSTSLPSLTSRKPSTTVASATTIGYHRP